jgi:dystonin
LQARPVASCLEQVRQLVLTSGNVLSIAEVTTLENSGRQLKFRVDRAHDSTIKLVKHLQNSFDELDKLQGEMHDFSKWLQSAQLALDNEGSYLSDLNQLPKQAMRIKDLQKEIIAHQADLRFITISTQKFVDEGKDYLGVLNDLRISLPERLPNIEPIASFKSPVRQTVSELQQRYSDLLGQTNAFADRQNAIREAYQLYNENLAKSRSWLSDVQIRVSNVIAHPVGTDIETIQEQSNMAKSLFNEFLANGKLIDGLQHSLDNLLVPLTGVTSPAENSALEIPVDQIKKDYKSLLEAIDNRCKMLEVAFIQAQGVQDALDNLIAHMKKTEDKIHLSMQPASLIPEKLVEQIREHQFILSDLETHRASLNSVSDSARELLATPSNARLAKVIESKLQSVTDNYSRLRDKANAHNEFLESIFKKLTKFNADSNMVEKELKGLQELANVDEKSVDILMKYLQDIVQNRKKIQPAYDDCVFLGKDLIERKDVTDSYVVRDKLKRLQTMWDSLEMRLDEKLKLTKQKSEKLAAFEVSRTEVLLWLTQMESRTSVFEPVALDLSVIRKQSDEHKLLAKEYKDFNRAIQRINDISSEYDSLIRSSSPTSNSVDRQDLSDLSSMQQELLEINNRYSFIGVKLNDRQKELEETRAAVQRQKESLEFLNSFLNKLEKDLPRYNLTIRDNAEKCIKHVRKHQDEMFEKQSALESTKIQIRELVQSKPAVQGAETLRNDLDSLLERWQRLADLLKECATYSEKSLDFLETYDLIFNWLVSKEKLLSVLGPISSDSRTVSSQMQQVSVLRDEFKAQQNQLDYLRDSGNSLVYHFKDNSQEGKAVTTKMNDIEKKWNDLADQLEKRYKSLNEVADTSKEFEESLNRLRENLQQISDGLDNLPPSSEFEAKLNKITQLERQLEGQRPLLADAEATAASLVSAISDKKSAADITAKVQALGKQYLALQKKLDNIKAESEAGLKDKRQFLENCAKTVGWITNKLSSLSSPLLVSAYKPTLQYQIETHEPIYREVMSKEYEIIMLLNRGKELQQKLGDDMKDIEKINNQWTRLKDEATDRQNRLQKANDAYKNYEKTSTVFMPWLTTAERDLTAMKPGVLVKKDLDREIREVQTLRNEVLKKSSDYDKTQNLCGNFLGTCDIDKDNLVSEMQTTKQRWNELNRLINLKLEKISAFIEKLMDFTDQFRQLSALVQRNEDAFDSLERVHGANAGRDPRSLEKIKTIKDDNAELKKNFQNLRHMVENIIAETKPAGYNGDNLYADLEGLSDRILTLQSRLDERFNDLQVASNAVAKFNEGINFITLDLTSLENEVDSLTAPGREVKLVKTQLENANGVLRKIEDVSRKIAEVESSGDSMIEKGFVSRPSEIHEPLDGVKRRRSRLESRTKDYLEAVQKALKMLTQFYENYDVALNDISQIDLDLKKIKSVGSEAQQIRLQQQEFQQFRKSVIDPMDRKIGDLNDLGKDLIRSASETVSTSALEGDLEKIVEKWGEIKLRIAERDRKLDQALLQTGKFQDALQGLLRWLKDSEDMIKNQKSPSIDYKVAKAQLQEQKFLMKMIGDNEYSISSLVQLGEEVAQGCDPSEKINIEMQLKDLNGRFDQLKSNANDRTKLLEKAVDISKLLQDQLNPLTIFLDRSEKALKNLENIPTDEDKLHKAIFEHDKLHKEVLAKDPEVATLTALKSDIRKYFEPEEAEIANEKIDNISDRYKMLRDDSERLGLLLNTTKQAMKQFSLAYQDLFSWCDKQERILAQYKNISVHVDVIAEQVTKLEGINNEAINKEPTIQTTMEVGNELIRSISHDEALKLKDKLDSLGRRYVDIRNKAGEYLNNAKDGLALAQDFHDAHNRLVNWMQNAESILVGNAASEIEILTLESDLTKMRSELESINSLGPQLAQLSSEEGGATLEGIISRDNRRFDGIVEQIQRKAERMQIIQQRSKEINIDLDELLQWFRDTENNLKDAAAPSIQPKVVKNQLVEHRALNDSISSQKGRVREVTSSAKKLIRELQSSNDNLDTIREKLEYLKDIVDSVTNLSGERLTVLEQVAPLSEHFADANDELERWLSDVEHEISMLTAPGVRADQIIQQQEKNERLMHTVANHKPLVDKFNKTGDAFAVLVTRPDATHLREIVEGVNTRYNALKTELRERQLALEKALQDSSQFADKLDNMLRTLANAADQVKNTEPASAHPPKISNQIDENWGIAEDLEKREDTYVAIKQAADDIISKATNHADPAVREIKMKLEKLNVLWVDVQKEVKIRDSTLNDTLSAAEKFWNELDLIMSRLRDLKDTLTNQEPVATEPKAIQRQQEELREVGHEIKNTKPEVDSVRLSGTNLITLVGDADKPEIKKHIEDLDVEWGNITSLYAQREENLIQAMEKAMQFHENLQGLLRFLDEAEEHVRNLKPIGSDVNVVKRQIEEHKSFKDRVDPHGVEVEALNRQLNELSEITSVDQTAAIRSGVNGINKRWDVLKQTMNERQKQLENALLQLGQFEHALNELMIWIKKTQATFDQIKIVPGDAKLLEIEMAKLKILINDMQAHQNSIDTINDAGRKLLDNDGLLDATATKEKLDNLNSQWQNLQRGISSKERELDDELVEAQNFATEMQDMLAWLNDVDNVVGSTKPVGGLPETATEQLEKFMEVYGEIEGNRSKVENLLAQGGNYVKKHGELNVTSSNLQHSLRTLKQRWESVVARAADKKIKLEIALKEATEFHESLQAFVEWLTDAEKRLTGAEPISRVLNTVQRQVEDHKSFQKEIGNYRESMLQLDKKGSHLKYFSQKQDVILIKNLLVSVQHRWERVVNKGTERMRALDHGYKESKEFYDSWTVLFSWLRENEVQMNKIDDDLNGSTDPAKIKHALEQTQNIHRGLSAKQSEYDSVLRNGKGLIERAPKADEAELNQMLSELKELWTRNCSRSIERQRKLEEALMLSGQFSEALTAILEWLQKAKATLTDDTPVHGDIDTVSGLVDKHKRFEADLEKRSKQIEIVIQNGKKLDRSTTSPVIIDNLREVEQLWSYVQTLNAQKNEELNKALREAEQLHKAVNILMEWLSDAEQKLKYAPAIPSDEVEAQKMLGEFSTFLYELRDKEFEKNETLSLAQNILNQAHPDAIKILRTIIQTITQRWEEISQWALTREQKLSGHLQSLKDLDGTIDDLLAWLTGLEKTLKKLEAEDLPNDVTVVEQLIEKHKEFMENTASRQSEIDMICKPTKAKPTLKDAKKTQSRTAMRTTR